MNLFSFKIIKTTLYISLVQSWHIQRCLHQIFSYLQQAQQNQKNTLTKFCICFCEISMSVGSHLLLKIVSGQLLTKGTMAVIVLTYSANVYYYQFIRDLLLRFNIKKHNNDDCCSKKLVANYNNL